MHGVEIIREYLKNYPNFYVLIGGQACRILFEEKSLPFRTTVDYDIVLIMECASSDALLALKKMLEDGGYKYHKKADGKTCRYRFVEPSTYGFPKIIEIFSHLSDVSLDLSNPIIPLEMPDDLSDISAILLNQEVYEFIKSNSKDHDGVMIPEALSLIALKAVAWHDNYVKSVNGEPVNKDNIRKHFRDIVRLLQMVNRSETMKISGLIDKALRYLINMIEQQKYDASYVVKSYSNIKMIGDIKQHFML